MTDTVPRIAFRVDSGALMGSGHVSRCLTLACELTRRGACVDFICRELVGNLIERIEHEGYPVWRLCAPGDRAEKHASTWLQVASAQDAEETRAVLEQLRATWLIVDHYGIDAEWQRAQRPVVTSILVIDDLADRSHDCDVLLDQNYMGSATDGRYRALVPERCRYLLGPRYALVGAEYAALRAVSGVRGRDAKRVLVFFGGTDATDETSKVLRVLCANEFSHLSVDVVLGSNHPAPDVVEALVAGRPGTILHRNLPSLAGLMARADLAVGAGGATTSERLCLSLPSVVVTVAANQMPATACLAEDGMIVWAGRAPVSIAELAAAIRIALGKAWDGHSVVDGYGRCRVTAALLPPSPQDVRLERAGMSDADLLLEWRNDPEARAMSFDEAEIPWDAHVRWFRAQLANPRVHLFIGKAGELPVGQVRLDFRADEVMLSYSVDPDLRGFGFGTMLVQEAVRSCRRIPAGGFIAEVKSRNSASRRIFGRLAWTENPKGSDFVYRLDADAARKQSRCTAANTR